MSAPLPADRTSWRSCGKRCRPPTATTDSGHGFERPADLVDRLAGVPGISFYPPEGTFYVWIRSDLGLTAELDDTHRVAFARYFSGWAQGDGKVMARLMYERLASAPERVYGTGIGSSYQHQGLTLSKQFRLE